MLVQGLPGDTIVIPTPYYSSEPEVLKTKSSATNLVFVVASFRCEIHVVT